MNMSYCRFQNTLEDLKDCLNNLDDLDMSDVEKRAKIQLLKVCSQIIEEQELIEREQDVLEEE